MAKTIRAFLAIEIPKSDKEKILKLIFGLKAIFGPAIKWVNRENLHITLKFIGDFNYINVSGLETMLAERLNLIETFNTHVHSLGAFPNNRKPRVIWLGLDQKNNLDQIFKIIEESAIKLGYSADQSLFSPHLTIGRVRREASREDIIEISKSLILNSRIYSSIEFPVEKVTLFQSELTKDGPIYTRLFQVPLAR